MSNESTRRDFLKLSGLGIATVATGKSAGGSVFSTNAAPTPGKISLWITDDHQRLARASDINWQAASDVASADAIVLNPQNKCQPILGFGAAFTDAACFVLSSLSAAVREKLFHEMFSPSEMGLNVCRTCIGASDYSTKLYGYDEGEPDPELSRFSIEHDREYILPILRAARSVNPELFLFASPWSPPGWMKANGSMLGGSMRRKYMPSYAEYFVKFLQGYEKEGVPINAVTIQNEVDTDQDGRMPACIWPQEYEVDFVRYNLGPLFERQGMKTKIWLVDHNYNLWGRAAAELETPDMRKYASGIAWHGYVGQPEWIDRVQRMYPDVAMYWTEGGPAYDDPNYSKDWTLWSRTFSTILHNWCRALTAWNFALDEHGKPNIGPFNCGGLVTVNSQTKDLSYSGQFAALNHYARFIRRGAFRFDSNTQSDNLAHCSFQNPNGERVVVITNSGAERSCQIQIERNIANLQLSPNSISTLVWHT